MVTDTVNDGLMVADMVYTMVTDMVYTMVSDG